MKYLLLLGISLLGTLAVGVGVYAEDDPLSIVQQIMKYPTYVHYDRVLAERSPSDNPITILGEQPFAMFAETVTGVRPGHKEAEGCGICVEINDFLEFLNDQGDTTP